MRVVSYLILKSNFHFYIDCIQDDELKSLLLNLNLNMTQLVLDDFKEAHLQDIGADSSRSGETVTWEQFERLYWLILRN